MPKWLKAIFDYAPAVVKVILTTKASKKKGS